MPSEDPWGNCLGQVKTTSKSNAAVGFSYPAEPQEKSEATSTQWEVAQTPAQCNFIGKLNKTSFACFTYYCPNLVQENLSGYDVPNILVCHKTQGCCFFKIILFCGGGEGCMISFFHFLSPSPLIYTPYLITFKLMAPFSLVVVLYIYLYAYSYVLLNT